MTSKRKYKKEFLKRHPYYDIIPRFSSAIKWSKLSNKSYKFRHVSWAKADFLELINKEK